MTCQQKLDAETIGETQSQFETKDYLDTLPYELS